MARYKHNPNRREPDYKSLDKIEPTITNKALDFEDWIEDNWDACETHVASKDLDKLVSIKANLKEASAYLYSFLRDYA